MTRPALLLALSLFAPLQGLDAAARAAVQAHRSQRFEAVMRTATEAGRPLMVAGAAAAVIAGPAGRALLGEFALVLLPVNLLVEGLKWITNRARPSGAHHRNNASFPSSHAANGFAIAWLLARRWRRGAVAWFALATLVGYSRLYLDRHWASDVVAGALIGAVFAATVPLAWSAMRRGNNLSKAT